MRFYIAGLSVALTSMAGCKTTPASTATVKNEPITRQAAENIFAESVIDYDVAKLKSHLANAQNSEMAGKALWAMFLEETQADSPCPGKALEAYYFIASNETDPAKDKYYVVTGKPMPMNGPCGLALDTEEKSYNEISRALMESSPLAEIGTFEKIKLSVRDAITKSEAKYKSFKYRDGVKIYRHLHPTTWDFPWYAVYGTACGIDATTYINAETGEFQEMLDSPAEGECPQK